MFNRQRPVTQLENFAPTTSQDEIVDALQTRAPRPKDTTALPRIRVPEKRKLGDESYSQASKLIKLPRDQSLPRSDARDEVADAEQPSINRSYHAFMTIDQAGSAIIAHGHANPGRLVAIKRVKPAKEMASFRLRPYKNDQVLSVLDTYVDGREIILIYEAMDITLRQMVSVCPVHVSKIAAIFKEVVYGLEYLHQELSLVHGSLSCDSILLKQSGAIKIANVGEALVKQIPYTKENIRIDIRSIGSALIETIEPETFVLDTKQLALRNRNEGSPEVRAFLAATESESLEELKAHPFLLQAVRGSCLAAEVFRALRVAGTGWDGIITL